MTPNEEVKIQIATLEWLVGDDFYRMESVCFRLIAIIRKREKEMIKAQAERNISAYKKAKRKANVARRKLEMCADRIDYFYSHKLISKRLYIETMDNLLEWIPKYFDL